MDGADIVEVVLWKEVMGDAVTVLYYFVPSLVG